MAGASPAMRVSGLLACEIRNRRFEIQNEFSLALAALPLYA
jgi:hypothetical protein